MVFVSLVLNTTEQKMFPNFQLQIIANQTLIGFVDPNK